MTRLAIVRAAIGALAIVALGGSLASARPTEAAWSDGEWSVAPATSGFVQRPDPGAACTIGTLGLDVTFRWAHGAGGVPRGGYVLTAYRQDGTLVGTDSFGPSLTSRSTSGLLTTLLAGQTYRIELQATHASTDPWRSTPLVGTITTTALGLVSRCTGLSVPA
ncbi:hypothetical protein [Agrococcus jejuensis]|uniref:hypothetical protein n=1 Tax=Agrococcus jejuensis TaxID=399736 RepID=UPI0021B4D57A|nr:hypothetical protein [Agrococcus jejuensis]